MINLGLARISRLLASTPIPWKAVHIAGTNGKGSVASIISSLLHASGISVGRFNSPHLLDRWDCISVNQKTVPKSIFLQVEQFVKDRNDAEKIEASEFELLTATAFEIFTGAKVEIGVVECGLGGRLDATNVLKPEEVLCSVITKIGMDHETLLGDTVVQIAREKAGILKKGVPFVIDHSNLLEVLITVDDVAEESGAFRGSDSLPAIVKQQISSPERKSHPSITVRTYEADRSPGSGRFPTLEHSLTAKHSLTRPGPSVDTSGWPSHQQQNLETALLAYHTILTRQHSIRSLPQLRALQPDGSFTVEQVSAIASSQNSWPGRLQLVDTSKITGNETPMLLDGAHNRQAAQALSKHVNATYRPQGSVTWVIAMSEGKNIQDIVSALVKRGDEVIVTSFGPVDGMPWVTCVDATVLAQTVRVMTGDRVRVTVGHNPWQALRIASERAGDHNQVVICGSLYLIADVLRLLRDDAPERLEGPEWDAWEQEQEKKLARRREGVFD